MIALDLLLIFIFDVGVRVCEGCRSVRLFHCVLDVVNLSVVDLAEGMSGCGGLWRRLGQGVAARPVISFQVVKRWCISVRYSVADSGWRRGRKCGDIRLKQARNRWARPGERKPFMARSRWRVGWCEFSARLLRYLDWRMLTPRVERDQAPAQVDNASQNSSATVTPLLAQVELLFGT